jgi:hypothetical protein
VVQKLSAIAQPLDCLAAPCKVRLLIAIDLEQILLFSYFLILELIVKPLNQTFYAL